MPTIVYSRWSLGQQGSLRALSVIDASDGHFCFQGPEPAVSADTTRLPDLSDIGPTAVIFPAVRPVPNYTAW